MRTVLTNFDKRKFLSFLKFFCLILKVSAPVHMNIQSPQPQYEQNPNRLELNAWNNQAYGLEIQPRPQEPVSKDGISGLKGKLYEQPSASNTSKSSINIVSSHDNHLFNNRSAQQIILNTSSHQSKPNEIQIQPQQQQHTVQFQIQPKQTEATIQPRKQGSGAIQYQIFDDDDIAASDI